MITLTLSLFELMSKNPKLWDTIWQIVKFILTLGLSHIAKREERRENETNTDTNETEK